MRYALDTCHSLENIRVASPCSVDWGSMAGDTQVRFCSECQRHVYNLSAMTAEQATALIREKKGTLCARFYRRRDGTLMTADGRTGLRHFARRPWRYAVALFAAMFA